MGLVLGGCTRHEAKPSHPASSHSTARSAKTSSSSQSSTHSTHSASHTAASTPKLPDKTGIPACDDYLASYKACHRAAHIFPADTIQSHYETMRTTLLEQSRDPKQREILPARCRSLNKLMREALHGKSCEMPAGAASSAASGSSS